MELASHIGKEHDEPPGTSVVPDPAPWLPDLDFKSSSSCIFGSMLDGTEFPTLLNRLIDAWERQDNTAAASCFTDDAVYMEPPDVQLYQGRDQLTAYFSPLAPGTYFDVHRIWFDAESQSGVVEFTFGVKGAELADHGVVVINTRNGLISSWREYPRKGPANFADFITTDGKAWQWHIGNYP